MKLIYLIAMVMATTFTGCARSEEVQGSNMKLVLGLKADSEVITRELAERIRSFSPATHKGLGKGDDPIRMIEVGFSCNQSGWCVIVLDTRSNAEPDGEWTSMIDANRIDFPNWSDVVDQSMETGAPVLMRFADGRPDTVVPAEEFDPTVAIGEMIRDVLLEARDSGLFNQLPLAESSVMGVEDIYGAYGWPVYERLNEEGDMAGEWTPTRD